MSSIPLPSAHSPLILALDFGSSSVRAILVDALGREIEGAVVQTKHSLRTTPDGGAEFPADELIERVCGAVDALLALQPEAARRIGAVGLSSFASNVLGLDQTGQAITPIYTYADTRAAPDADRLREMMSEVEVHDRVGTMIHASYLPARFAWLARTRPALVELVRTWMSLGDYLFLKLFGRTATSISVASWTGLLNRRTLTWDADLLAHLNLDPDRLPPLVDASTPFAGLRPEYAERWPALRDVPWFPAIGDGAAANIGSGCVAPEAVSLTIGTTGAMRVIVADPDVKVPLGLWLYRVDARRSLLGGAFTEGGNLFAWMRSTLRLDGDLETQLAAMEPDGHGLTVLPFLAGERSPGWAGNARATISGLSFTSTPLDLLRAGLESIAIRFALVYNLLSEAVPQAREVIASGGAILASPAWMQMAADALNRPLVASGEAEASSRGVALLALESLGVLRDLRDAPPALGEAYYPDPARHAKYRAAMERQKALYEALVRR
ncbi:MAG: gluconokinase [Chloroflexi bacterium]|nr:gluconokinase [Chloroflexota bacterium]